MELPNSRQDSVLQQGHIVLINTECILQSLQQSAKVIFSINYGFFFSNMCHLKKKQNKNKSPR